MNELANIGKAFALLTAKLQRVSQRERDFWAAHGGGARSRQALKRMASYGRRRATHAHSSWRRS